MISLQTEKHELYEPGQHKKNNTTNQRDIGTVFIPLKMKSIILFKLKHSSKKNQNLKKIIMVFRIFFFFNFTGIVKEILLGVKKNCVNLTGLRDAQISGETFLGISERVFLEEISL